MHNIIKCYTDTATTKPYLCVLDNGKQAVVKYPNNPEGSLPLINEYLSFKIAEKLNLNVPRCGLCILNEDVLVPENVAQSQFAPKTENCGVSFFSEYITRTTPVRLGLVPKLKNKEEFFKMVLFDHLIYNKDRNPGNILIKVQSGFTLYLIDHSHVFKNQCIWDQYTFLQGIRDRDYLDLTILEYNDDV